MKIKRIAAAFFGILLVLGLLFFWEYMGDGDPLSAWIGQKRAVAYAERRYPGQTFTVLPDAAPCGRIWQTNIWVQSDTSPDTCFGVTTRWWFFTESWEAAPPERMVEGRQNTKGRLEWEAGEYIAALLKEQLPDLPFSWANFWGADSVYVTLCVQPDGSTDTAPYLPYLPLDVPFAPELLQNVPALVELWISWPANPTQQDAEAALSEVKAVLEANGLPVAYYTLELKPDSADFEEVADHTIRLENIPASAIS